MRRAVLFAGIASALISLVSTRESAAREPLSTTSDRIIFAKGEALWSIPSTGGSPQLLAKLPGPASEVSRIKVAASGTAMLLRIGKRDAWAPLHDDGKATVLQFLNCNEKTGYTADISGDGDRIICASSSGQRIIICRLRPKRSAQVLHKPAHGPLFFAGERRYVGYGPSENLVDLASGAVLAPHRPTHTMALSADGKHAIGGYAEDGIDVVYTFHLDGRATKRTLMQAARVVTVSANSNWASLQQELDACAVRVTGGQYMCWRRYQAMDISSSAHNLLMSRAGSKVGHDLYLGSVSGTEARKPSLLVEAVGRVAVFWPSTPSLSSTLDLSL